MPKYLVDLLIEILKKMDVEKMLKDLLQSSKEQLVCFLQMKAIESGTPLDDVAVGIIASVLEVDASKCKVTMPGPKA